MKSTIVLILSGVMLGAALLLSQSLHAAPAASIVVNTTLDTVSDDGVCTLREALQAANTDSAVGGCAAGSNAPEGDTITFDIPGDGPHTIKPQSELPAITSRIAIDGLSQSGATCVSNIPAAQTSGAAATMTELMVELDGSEAGAANGLVFEDGSEFSAVSGLAINRFKDDGIFIGVSTDFYGVNVFCNWIGVDADGATVAGNEENGVTIQNSGFNRLQSNVVAGNEGWGILITGSEAKDNTVEDNYIGTNADGANLGNGLDGILGLNSGPQIIGGTYTGQGCCLGNTIAFNGGAGVAVSAAANASLEKGIRGNRIYSNDDLGIDLEVDGVTLNDLGDADGENMANGLQNFPVIEAASIVNGNTLITGTLNSKADTRFQIDFFANDVCDPSGYGEGQRFIGVESVNTNASGNVDFTATFTGTAISIVNVGNLITATASDPSGNTSEFGKCVEVTGLDSGPADIRVLLPLLQG